MTDKIQDSRVLGENREKTRKVERKSVACKCMCARQRWTGGRVVEFPTNR